MLSKNPHDVEDAEHIFHIATTVLKLSEYHAKRLVVERLSSRHTNANANANIIRMNPTIRK